MTITAPPVAAAEGATRSYEAQRGYADQAAWLRGKSVSEAEQALAARLATQDGSDYNAGATAATREFIAARRALIDDIRRVAEASANPGASPCGHPPFCACPTPDPTSRLNAGAGWDIARIAEGE